ncbi:cytochrome b [Castellaniella defragrans]|uniref:Cytochrome b561 n=1 Tax=Castellaniella defragrans TaxID=75697 RepID=A0A7W9TP30_CASDE|nr:cytochrome b [Castellaniella defragrans]KAB0595063.1 cytochrome b [Castellaniella defragrans]MBB6082967.1 cytochrome b561 [Castellaniella defragrans]
MPATPTTWSPSLKFLHWSLFVIIAAAVVCVVAAGGYERGDPVKGQLMFFHKSFGLTALALMIAWVATRLNTGRPQPVGQSWQLRLASTVHWAMVVLVLALPLAGLLMSQFAQQSVSFFGLFSIPVWLDEDKAAAKAIHTVHAGFAGPILVGLVVLHTVGALWHHFIDRDGTLTRMLPGKDR